MSKDVDFSWLSFDEKVMFFEITCNECGNTYCSEDIGEVCPVCLK